MVKTYVINLDKNPIRMAYMAEQLEKVGMAYERFPAVYGKSLSLKELSKSFSPFRWWCAMGRPSTPGEIGCALSHCGVYRKIVDEGVPYALVLEDDVRLSVSLREVVQKGAAFLDSERPQVMILSKHKAEAKTEGIYPIDDAMCADGYLLTLAAAKALLKANYPVVTVSDAWGRWGRRRQIELYRIYPSVVCQDGTTFNESDVRNDFVVAGARRAKVRRVITRGIGKVVDYLIWIVFSR